MRHSFCLSADVTAAFDPNFAEVYEKRNSRPPEPRRGSVQIHRLPRQVRRQSDASAEVVGYVRKLFERQRRAVAVGRAGQGGRGRRRHRGSVYGQSEYRHHGRGGTPVLAMHSPFEVTGKLDCYMTYRSMKAVFEA